MYLRRAQRYLGNGASKETLSFYSLFRIAKCLLRVFGSRAVDIEGGYVFIITGSLDTFNTRYES